MIFDLAIIGSGFGGSLLAMVARRLGLSVVLIERGTHPRFAIGESTSPLTNLLLEELVRDYDLPRLLPLTSYGLWKRAYPEIGVGLKRGFTFYGHQPGREHEWTREQELLVAASPNDEVGDTHWYRADFDHFLVREAQSLGVEYVDRTEVTSFEREGDWIRLGRFRSRFVVDASGQRGAISRLLQLPEQPFDTMPPTQGLFTHFTNVGRLDETHAGGDARAPGEGPYRPDDAALHHVFPGGWIWVLRFDNGITSAGIAAEDWLARELRLSDSATAWERVLERFPTVRQHFEGSEAVLPWVHSPRLSYRAAQLTGPGWALLPSAASFIDPLFSTGFPLTLLGIHRLGRLIRDAWGAPRLAEGLERYAAATRREAEASALLVGASYATFHGFPAFAALSMLYFVAASYAEMARRLDRPELASEFLLQNNPLFRELFTRHCRAALGGSPSAAEEIARDLEPFNIAGLCDAGKRNWYGVDLNDVLVGAGKLKATPDEVRALFRKMGLG